VPAPVVAAAHGRLILLVPASRAAPDVPAALDALGSTWIATSASAVTLLDVAAATREASAALSIAIIGSPRRRIVPSRQLALERALLADPSLLRAAIDVELGPLLTGPRAAGLVETLETYLGERENVRATARRLGVASRTVTYRLDRIERLLGGRLDADRRLRLATVLFARRLLRA
jgi:DNA-binding PucR family transcriptional regulator